MGDVERRTDVVRSKPNFMPRVQGDSSELKVTEGKPYLKNNSMETTKLIILDQHKLKVATPKVQSVARRDACSTTNNGFSNDIVPKTATTLNLTPEKNLFTGKRSQHMHTRRSEKINCRSRALSPKPSSNARSSLKTPTINSGRESKTPKADRGMTEKQSFTKETGFENFSLTAWRENRLPENPCKGQELKIDTNVKPFDLKRRRDKANDEAKIQNVEQPCVRHTRLLSDCNEELPYAEQSVFKDNERFKCISQSIFSQSLFDNVPDDDCAKRPLSDICESVVSDETINNLESSSHTGIHLANLGKECRKLCDDKDEKGKYALKNNKKNKCAAADLKQSPISKMSVFNFSALSNSQCVPSNSLLIEINREEVENFDLKSTTLSGLKSNNVIQKDVPNSPNKLNSDITTSVGEVRESLSNLPANSLPQGSIVFDNTQHLKSSRDQRKDLSSQHGENNVPLISSGSKTILAKDTYKQTTNDKANCSSNFISPFLLEKTDKPVANQDIVFFPSSGGCSHASKCVLQSKPTEELNTVHPKSAVIFVNDQQQLSTARSERIIESPLGKKEVKNSVSRELNDCRQAKDKSSCNVEKPLSSLPFQGTIQCDDHLSDKRSPFVHDHGENIQVSNLNIISKSCFEIGCNRAGAVGF